MNGAELPCGSVLQVEPADTNYYHGGVGEKHESTDNKAPNSTVATEQSPKGRDSLQGTAEETKTNDPDAKVSDDIIDDLDDFFHSLE
jgi:hypothetical protein